MAVLAHIADLHVGARLRGVPNYPGAPEIDPVETPYAAFDALVAAVLTGRYDGVLVAGDIFDRSVPDQRAVDAVNAALAAFNDAGLPVAVILGNHDAESALPRHLRLPPGAWLASADAPGTVRWPGIGVAVHGQSIADPAEARDLAVGYPRPEPGMRNVGLLHTSLTGEHSRRALAPTTADRLEALGYDYWALGHVHHRWSPSPTVGFAGSVCPAREVEFGPRGHLRVDLGRRPHPPAVTPVDTSPIVRERLRAATAEEVAAAFAAYRRAPHDPVVVWAFDGPPGLLAQAREIAAGFAGFGVVAARPSLLRGR